MMRHVFKAEPDLLRTLLLLCGLSLILVSCASTRFDLPPVADTDSADTLPGKIIWHDLISDTPQRTEAFYAGLFGWEFESLSAIGANYSLIRHRGKLIGGMVDQNRLPTDTDISQWVVVMAVADVAVASASVVRGGGAVLTPPTSLGERGTISVVTDPQGAVLALLQTEGLDPADDEEQIADGDFLWNELWARDPAKAADFYRTLAPLDLEEHALSGEVAGSYRVLSSQEKARAGIRETPVPDMPPMWVTYLRVADLAGLEEIVSRTGDLGGTVLMPATARPLGGHVAVIADPSGAGIALQTWPLVQGHGLITGTNDGGAQ